MLTMAQVLDVTCRSVLQANRTYMNWSGGATIHEHSIESLVCAAIGKGILEAGQKNHRTAYVTLETPFRDIKTWSKARAKRGKPYSALDKAGKVDVVYYNQNEAPIGIFEVKRHFYSCFSKEDVKRIVALLQNYGAVRGGSLRWGCIVGFHADWRRTDGSTKRRKTFQERVNHIEDQIRARYPQVSTQSCVRHREFRSDFEMDGWYLKSCAVGSVLMKPKAI